MNIALMNENALLRAQIERLEGRVAAIRRERTADEVEAMRQIQTRADAALTLHGERAGEPTLAETPIEYRRRLAALVAKHSPRFKGESLSGLGAGALRAAEDIIYADAVDTARTAASVRVGNLFPERTRDDAGRLVTRYHGDPIAWMEPFMRGGQVGRIVRREGNNQ